MNREESLEKLRQIRETLGQNRELYKAYFGLLFWQLLEASKQMSVEEISAQSGSLTLEGQKDEEHGILLGFYLQIWDSAKDFNAASRFLAETLQMSADELIQCKILFEKQSSPGSN